MKSLRAQNDELVTAAKSLLDSKSTLNPVPGTDTNLCTDVENYLSRNNLDGITVTVKDPGARDYPMDVAQTTGIAADGNDVMAVYEAASEAVARARKGQGPTLIECKTYRHRGHFEGDPSVYKPKDEQAEWLKKDPIPRYRKFLQENGFATEDELDAVDRRVQEELAEAVRFANESPLPTPESVVQDIYSDIVEEVRAR